MGAQGPTRGGVADVFNAAHRWSAGTDWDRAGLDRVATWSRRRRIRPLERRTDPPPAPRRPPLVSVVIPCFDYGRYLPDTLESVLGQEGVDLEVIVVDDASTDDSAEVAAAYAARDPRVRLVRQRVNRGQVLTFNHGLSQATGELVARLDADDLLTPGSLARSAAVLEDHPGVGLVYGHPREFPDPHVPEPRVGRPSWTVWSGADWVRLRCLRGVNAITTSEAVVRRSVIERLGGFNPSMRFACDMEWWLRIATVCDVARVNDVDQALHRDHADSLSVTDAAGAVTDLRERRLVFDELFAATGHHFPDAAHWHGVARRALAREALGHASYAIDRGRYDAAHDDVLVAFALDADPDVRHTLAWRAHAARLRVGPGRVRRDPLALARVARVRARDELAYLHWVRLGL